MTRAWKRRSRRYWAGDSPNRRGDVDADLWRVRDTKATIPAPFELASSRGGAAVKLADYRGKLVLLAFWFPG